MFVAAGCESHGLCVRRSAHAARMITKKPINGPRRECSGLGVGGAEADGVEVGAAADVGGAVDAAGAGAGGGGVGGLGGEGGVGVAGVATGVGVGAAGAGEGVVGLGVGVVLSGILLVA